MDDLSEERASAQIRIEQHSDFRWRRAKSWKRCQAWFWIDRNQSLQPNPSQMKCDVWKPCSDQRWQDDSELRVSIWRFFEQFSFVNNRLLCYWPTIHNSISKICPTFQVISTHFFEVDEVLNEHSAKIVRNEFFFNSGLCRMREDVSIKGLRSRILVYRVWPWYSTWAIREQQTCRKKAVPGCEKQRFMYRSFSSNRYKSMA